MSKHSSELLGVLSDVPQVVRNRSEVRFEYNFSEIDSFVTRMKEKVEDARPGLTVLYDNYDFPSSKKKVQAFLSALTLGLDVSIPEVEGETNPIGPPLRDDGVSTQINVLQARGKLEKINFNEVSDLETLPDRTLAVVRNGTFYGVIIQTNTPGVSLYLSGPYYGPGSGDGINVGFVIVK